MLSRRLLIATLVMFSVNVSAQNLSYPELEVVPSAEERLKNASLQEKDSFFENNWQMILPSSLLLLRGISLNSNIELKDEFASDAEKRKDDIKEKAQLSALVGASWLALTYYMHRKNLYTNDYERVSKLPNKSMAEKLARARYSEEALLSRYKTMGKLKWLLAGSTLLFSAIEIENAGSTASALSALGILSAGAPLFFDHYWQSTYENYETSKKRIYGPIVSAQVFGLKGSKSILPGMQISFRF